MSSTPDSVSKYDIGDLVQLRATFLATDGVTPADPSAMTFYVKSPAGTIATYVYGIASVARAGVGAFFVDVTVDFPGKWWYRAVGTGGAQAAEEWPFIVAESFIL